MTNPWVVLTQVIRKQDWTLKPWAQGKPKEEPKPAPKKPDGKKK